MHGWF